MCRSAAVERYLCFGRHYRVLLCPNIHKVVSCADGRARKPVKITGSGGPEGGPKSEYVAYVFVFIGTINIGLFYIRTLSAHASHSATDSQSVRFSAKIFNPSDRAGEAEGQLNFLHRSPPPVPDVSQELLKLMACVFSK